MIPLLLLDFKKSVFQVTEPTFSFMFESILKTTALHLKPCLNSFSFNIYCFLLQRIFTKTAIQAVLSLDTRKLKAFMCK